ncbi:MAG: hypothetical protein OXC62_10740 [Aestuariivita sp.]|nr:hypothetical protein [Aestuariivita sp.]
MYRTLLVFIAIALLSGCTYSSNDNSASARVSPSDSLPVRDEIYFGNDSSSSANFDGQCDDNRFIGSQRYYMHFDHGGHNFKDATDCRQLLSQGLIRLRTAQETRDSVIATDW